MISPLGFGNPDDSGFQPVTRQLDTGLELSFSLAPRTVESDAITVYTGEEGAL